MDHINLLKSSQVTSEGNCHGGPKPPTGITRRRDHLSRLCLIGLLIACGDPSAESSESPINPFRTESNGPSDLITETNSEATESDEDDGNSRTVNPSDTNEVEGDSPAAEGILTEDTIGDPCESDADCVSEGEICLREIHGSEPQTLPGGYCTKSDCQTETACSEASSCKDIESLDTQICLRNCSINSDCRNGYECIENRCWITEPEDTSRRGTHLIKGKLTYDYYQPGYAGGHSSLRLHSRQPADGLLALIYNANNEYIGATYVEYDGRYQFEADEPIVGGEKVYFVPGLYLAEEEDWAFIMANPEEGSSLSTGFRASPWSWVVYVPSSGQVRDLNITREQGSGAVYAYQVIAESMITLANEEFGGDLAQLPSLALWWRPDQSWECGACFSNLPHPMAERRYDKSIFMTGNDIGGVWSTPTLLHEFGHYLMVSVSRNDSRGGPHSRGRPAAPPLAMSEGFATFNALRQLSRHASVPVSQLHMTYSNVSMTVDYGVSRTLNHGNVVFPDPSGLTSDDIDEQVITVALWQLYDGSEVDEDGINDGAAFGFTEIIDYMQSRRYLEGDRGAAGADLVDLFDAIYCADDGRWDEAHHIAEEIIGLPYHPPLSCP